VTTAIKWLAGRILRLLPERLRGAVLPGRFGFTPGQVPPATTAPSTAVRLYIAPVNYAGQAWQWARAAERHLDGVGAISSVVRVSQDFRHPADEQVPLGVYAASTRWQRAQFAAVSSGFTHVIVEAQKQPFGAVLDETTLGQVRRLQNAGVRVLMLCHGTDIRLPSRHLAANPGSPFADALAAVAPVLEREALKSRALLDRLGVPVFVSTPDLLLDVPYATWLPVVVDPALWAVDEPALRRAVPVVAHAPSNAAVKGSDLLDPVLAKLQAEGLLEYRRIQGVPFEKMREVYRDADIVLDQFRLGDYGVAACEAMAAGRLVIAHVSEHSRSTVAAASGLELPIVEAGADEVEDVLRRIIADRGAWAEVAARGPAFVTAVHNGRLSADVLRPHLLPR